MFLGVLILTFVPTVFSTTVTVHPGADHTNSIQLYPNSRPYYQYSCVCLLNMNLDLTSNFSIVFSDLSLGCTLYFQLNHPPFIEYDQRIQNTSDIHYQLIQLNKFNQTGFQTVLYFQESCNNSRQEHWVHFTITNTTESESTSIMISEIDNSFFIITILVAVFSIFFGRFTHIYRFKVLNITWYHFIIYAIIVTIYIALLYSTPYNVFKYFQMIVVGLLGLLCSYYYIEETIAACGFRYRIRKIYIRDVVAAILAIGIIVLWIYLGNNWIMNDIIGLFIVGSVIKLIKIGSLKGSIAFLLLVLVFNISMELIFTFKKFSIQYKLMNNYPSPLQFQLPTLDFFSSKRCTWIQITDMIFPGFLINYCRRIDISLNIQIYFILSVISVVSGVAIQMITYKLMAYRVQLPQAIFSMPIMIIFMYLVSLRRGEWSIVWHGGFYDKTVERRSLRRSVEWDTIIQSLDEKLMIN